MKRRWHLRVEWISLVYLTLFVLAVLSPSLVTGDILGVDQQYIEEMMIFVFGIVGLVIFSVYQRLMERKEQEHEDAKNEYDRAKRELVESYQYIGSVNRQLDVLKRLVNQTSVKIVENDHLTKELLTSLLANAAASVNASTAFIRYVELDKLRTVHEMVHSLEKNSLIKLSNRELKKVQERGVSHAFLSTEDGQEVLVVPSDHRGRAVKAYLVIAATNVQGGHVDMSLLKVFANQAELLYYTLAGNGVKGGSLPPLELVKEAERRVVGEVS